MAQKGRTTQQSNEMVDRQGHVTEAHDQSVRDVRTSSTPDQRPHNRSVPRSLPPPPPPAARPVCDIPSGCSSVTGALDSHPVSPPRAASGRCVLTATAAGVLPCSSGGGGPFEPV